MPPSRETHTGLVGWEERARPEKRHAPRQILFTDNPPSRKEGVPLAGLGRLLADGKSFFFGEFQAPTAEELDRLASELRLHPLAIEDVRTRHQRPKIDVYGNHYFLVCYQISSRDRHVAIEEIDVFIGPNFLVVCHDGEVPLLAEVEDRFSRQMGSHDVSGLLYEILDAVVDEYFPVLDELAERTEAIESAVFEKFERRRLAELLDLKKDLALLRRVIAPERDAVNVLLRRDPPVLDPSRIFYFQDVYDHLIRITDSIDTYRDLLTGSLDAFLSVENNRLSEIVRRLTLISTVFLPMAFVTGFFGMNFKRLVDAGDSVFVAAIAAMILLPLGLLALLRRQGIR